MRRGWKVGLAAVGLVVVGTLTGALGVRAQGASSSYIPVNEEDFRTVFARMSAAKASTMKRQMDLLNARYDLGDRPAAGVTMSGGKAIQDGVRVKLPAGLSWAALAKMSPDEIRDKGLYPAGFMPLPHENHPEGGMVFPGFMIAEVIPAPIAMLRKVALMPSRAGRPKLTFEAPQVVFTLSSFFSRPSRRNTCHDFMPRRTAGWCPSSGRCLAQRNY